MRPEIKSRDRILNAAIPVFARKGRHGAHMEEIANLAHINKAMIYYIFHSKDDLYLEVLKHVFHESSNIINTTTEGDINNGKDYPEVLSNMITNMISYFSKNRNYTKVMVDAMSSGADEIPVAIRYFKQNYTKGETVGLLKEFIIKGINEKSIREIDPNQLIISIVGMVMVYFMSSSITESLNIEITDEKEFLEERRKSIIDLVLNSIIIRKKGKRN